MTTFGKVDDVNKVIEHVKFDVDRMIGAGFAGF
jgi:hypothetical protein